jgi:hypothetical protein
MGTTAERASLAGVTHHHAKVNGTELHYVAAGTEGTPVLLVHGFPETWWAFRKLIPLLAASHRVYAVDLSGFGVGHYAALEAPDQVAHSFRLL